MAPTIENDLVLATMHCTHILTARESLVTFAFNDGTINASAQDWAVNLHNAWGAAMDDPLTTEAAWTRVTTLKGDGSTTPEQGESIAPLFQGDNAMAATPPNTAILVQKKTAFGGRRNRGRVYLPWSLNEGEVGETGLISATYRNAVQANVDAFYNSAGVGVNMVIANRVYDSPWTNPARILIALEIGRPVISLLVQNMAATQRRRMPR